MVIPAVLSDLIPVVLVLLSLAAAVVIFPMREQQVRLRSWINIVAASVKVLLLIVLVPPVVTGGARPEYSVPLLPAGGDGQSIDLVLRADPLALFFAGLSSLLWLLTTVYAIGYLRGTPNRSRFFGFFSLCMTATVGISFSGNLITFLVFYELLTLVTYPLVAHWGTPGSLRAARTYLRYALSGGLAVLIGVVWLTLYAGPVDFAEEGGADAVGQLAAHSPEVAVATFMLLAGGLAVKSALFPVHAWLPAAMVAPYPVSALLHAVAVVKAGVFGIVRVVDDVFGIQVAGELGVLPPLLGVAAFTVLYGSYQALRHQDLKRRLAYSTVSQVSYVVLGVTMMNVLATSGGVVHLVHQGIMKITLFFCAGLFAEVLKAHRISELRGAGLQMPWTSAAFTVGALGMIGLPPTAGFISKWQLGSGALAGEHGWVLWVLIASSLFNAAYFLPVVWELWFRERAPGEADGTQDDEAEEAAANTRRLRVHEPKTLMVPAVLTAGFTLALGLGANLPFAPLQVAEYIAEAVFS